MNDAPTHAVLLTVTAAVLNVLGAPNIDISLDAPRRGGPPAPDAYHLTATETRPTAPDPRVSVEFHTQNGGGVRLPDHPDWPGVLAVYTPGMSAEAFTEELRDARRVLVSVWHDEQAGLL